MHKADRHSTMSRFPIDADRQVTIPADRRRRIGALADEIRARDPRIGDTSWFGPEVVSGMSSAPGLLFGDSGEIPLVLRPGRVRFDYRIGWLGGNGDLVVTGSQPCPAFEEYQRGVIKAPGLSYAHIGGGGSADPVVAPVSCLRDPSVFARLAEWFGGWRETAIIAHITTGTIWALASRLVAQAGVGRVLIAGPPPLLSRRVNDKLWFGAICRRLLGAEATPEKRAAHSASALVRHARDLATRHDRIVVKLPDSAGSAGNMLFETADFAALDAFGLRNRLTAGMASIGAGGIFPVAVEVWDVNVLASPSAQIWIPKKAEGPPAIMGVFEQILSGTVQSFAGAMSAVLPARIEEMLVEQAMEIALLFQELGYFGPCSFDSVVTGPDPETARLHWIECNGRWGGVSLPLTLARRLGMASDALVIVQERSAGLTGPGFDRVRSTVEEDVAGAGEARSVLLSPEAFEAGSGMHFLTMAGSRDRALAAATALRQRLIAL